MSLELKKIEKSYPEFDLDLTFRAERGELLTLLGPSGCGKTTTLHLIAGFISPASGTIFIDGEEVTTRPAHVRNLGVVFQDYALFPNMDVSSNISFGLRMHGWDRDRIRKRVQYLLELVRLTGYEHRIVTRLSGGEQQRVALARALAPEPRLLLLDEPLSALDAKLRKELRTEIKRIQRTLHLTTLYVTHDQEEALAISDKIVVMQAGKIEQTGIPLEIYNRPRSLFVADFMGVSNRIDGKVVGQTDDYVTVNTAESPFVVRYTESVEKGMHVTVVFRPEKCRLFSSGTLKDDLQNSVRGRLVSSEYIGEHTIVRIETEHGRYEARLTGEYVDKSEGNSWGTSVLSAGTPVRFYVPPEHLWLIH